MNNSNLQNKIPLILITQSFPFGIAESSFLKEEIKVLSRVYNVHIVSRNPNDIQYVEVPDNVTLYRYNPSTKYNVLYLLIQTLCTFSLYAEILDIFRKKKNLIFSIKKCMRVQMRILHFKRFLKGIRQKIEGNVIWYSYWNDYSCFSATIVKRKGDFVISRLHGGDLYELDINNNYQPFKCLYNKNVDWFSFISYKGLSYFNDTYYDVSSKASVNYLGVPERVTSYNFTDRKDVKIISFSYVRDIKRIDKIVDALSIINEIKVKWVHIGGRYIFDQIKKYAHHKLNNKVNIDYEFLGEMKNEDALSYISKNEFDFLVNVSSTEGMPMTMMEAFSMSLPVIGTKVGGVPEVITHGINGFLLDVDFSNEDLSKMLLNYVSLPFDSKCTLRANAKETWKLKFYDVSNYNSYVKLLKDNFRL